MPLGEEYGGATYFLLETHYDNPSIHQNILDSSGMITLLRNLRCRLDEMALRIASKFVIFLEYEKPCRYIVFFSFSCFFVWILFKRPYLKEEVLSTDMGKPSYLQE